MPSNNSFVNLEEVISYMPGNVYWTDINGVYQGCNTNVAKVLKLESTSSIVGKKIHELIVDQKIADEVNRIDAEVMRNNREVVIEQEGFDAEGAWAVYLTQKIPLHNTTGEVIGVLGISVDITKLKLAEKAILEAKAAAEAANRAKTEFLANISHDVQSPLAAVLILAQKMLENAKDAGSKQAVEILLSCQRQLSTFFKNCLDNANFELENPIQNEGAFSLKKMLHELYDIFFPETQRKDLHFEMYLAEDIPNLVKGYEAMMFRVILNLINNAIKFTEKGSVIIHVDVIKPIHEETISIELKIQDTGMGIPEEKQHVIFERLSRLAPAFAKRIEGSGIGLYIVDQYIKYMGGKITVKSKVGEGSTFIVSVPLKVVSDFPSDFVVPQS